MFDFLGPIERYVGGSHYRIAKLRDPKLIAEIAKRGGAMPKATPPPALEEFDSLRAELAEIKDILWIIAYTAGHNDPKHAPKTPRPEMPWDAVVSEMLAQKSAWIRARMVPWEVN